MTKSLHNVTIPLDQIEAFCLRNPIQRLSLFGSIVRDDFTEKSDVDVLVEFLPAGTPGLVRFLGMQDELEGMIGRKVDLRTPNEFHERNLRRVLAEAETLYVRKD